jgi:hypothetical protein
MPTEAMEKVCRHFRCIWSFGEENLYVSRNQKVEDEKASSEVEIRRHLGSDRVWRRKGNYDRR